MLLGRRVKDVALQLDDKRTLALQVASWWDYGYQTTAMANRTVIVDNNTWNNTHIATVGRAMASPERRAWKIYRDLDVEYVLVVFGGFIGCGPMSYTLSSPGMMAARSIICNGRFLSTCTFQTLS